MSKNFVVVTLPLTNSDDFIDISKEAFFSEVEGAKEYIEKIVFEETGNSLSLADRSSEVRVLLPNSILELWVCYMPNPDFLN